MLDESNFFVQGSFTKAESVQKSFAYENTSIYLARYNKAPCLCPQWEVYVEDQWTRLYIEPSSSENTKSVELPLLTDTEEQSSQIWLLALKPTLQRRKTNNDNTFQIFLLENILKGPLYPKFSTQLFSIEALLQNDESNDITTTEETGRKENLEPTKPPESNDAPKSNDSSPSSDTTTEAPGEEKDTPKLEIQ